MATLSAMTTFFEKAPDEQEDGVRRDRRGERPRHLDLRDQMPRALNRPRNELRKKRHEEHVIAETPARADVPAGDVHDVTDTLKRVERDARRQHHLQHRERHVQVQRVEQRGDIRDAEIVVFENAEQPEIAEHADRDQLPLPRRRILDPARDEVVDDRGHGERQEKPRLIPPVENEAHRDEQEIPPARRDAPVKREDDGEKNEVGEAVKDHRAGAGRSGPTLRQNISV